MSEKEKDEGRENLTPVPRTETARAVSRHVGEDTYEVWLEKPDLNEQIAECWDESNADLVCQSINARLRRAAPEDPERAAQRSLDRIDALRREEPRRPTARIAGTRDEWVAAAQREQNWRIEAVACLQSLVTCVHAMREGVSGADLTTNETLTRAEVILHTVSPSPLGGRSPADPDLLQDVQERLDEDWHDPPLRALLTRVRNALRETPRRESPTPPGVNPPCPVVNKVEK